MQATWVGYQMCHWSGSMSLQHYNLRQALCEIIAALLWTLRMLEKQSAFLLFSDWTTPQSQTGVLSAALEGNLRPRASERCA